MLKNILGSKIDFCYTKHHRIVLQNYFQIMFFRIVFENSYHTRLKVLFSNYFFKMVLKKRF